ncbi:MAG: hypothetical protein ACYC26_04940 [Phycisphaerales bacterium]
MPLDVVTRVDLLRTPQQQKRLTVPALSDRSQRVPRLGIHRGVLKPFGLLAAEHDLAIFSSAIAGPARNR